jgi:hypothetical protein
LWEKQSAQKIMKKSANRLNRIKTAHVPTWFKAAVTTASRGGTQNYCDVGYETCRHLSGLLPGRDADEDEKSMDEFNQALNESDNNKELRKWARRWIPHILVFIPFSRRNIFFQGFAEFLEKESTPF